MHDHNHTIDYAALNPHSHDIREDRRYHWPDLSLDRLDSRQIAELRAELIAIQAQLLDSSVSSLRQKLQQQEESIGPRLSNATITYTPPEPAKSSASTPANPAFDRILRVDARPPRIGLRYLGD